MHNTKLLFVVDINLHNVFSEKQRKTNMYVYYFTGGIAFQR